MELKQPNSAPSESVFLAKRPAIRVDAIENYVRGLLASTTDGGLVPGQLYNLEFVPPPVGTAPTQLLNLAAPSATLTT